MKYDNADVRRRDRLLDEARAWQLLGEGEYGFLSMVDEDGSAYGIPISYVWDGEEAIYLHCAMQGRKLRALQRHPQVSFCVVGNVQCQPAKFTTLYESIVLTGTARLNLPDDERREALRRLVRKYAPDEIERGETYIEKSFFRTNIVRIDLTKMSGKRKQAVSPTPSVSQ